MNVSMKEYEIIKVSKVTGSKRKDRKRGYNTITLTVPFIGDVFIYESGKDGVYDVYLEEQKRKENRFVRNQNVSISSYAMQKILNVRNLYECGTWESIWCHKNGKSYRLTKSTDKEIEAYGHGEKIPGMVTRTGMLYLGAKTVKEITGTYKNLICEIEVGDHIYLNVVAVSEKEYKETLPLPKILNDFQFPEGKVIRYRASLIHGTTLYLPAAFFRLGNIEKRKRLSVYQTEDGNGLYVDVSPIICDICGQSIQRRTEKVKVITVSEAEKSAAGVIRNAAYKEGSIEKADIYLRDQIRQLMDSLAIINEANKITMN